MSAVQGMRRQVEIMRDKPATVQWLWLNRVVDPADKEQDAQVAEVMRAVCTFMHATLTKHPFYGTEAPMDKEGGRRFRASTPWSWAR